ncbi:hypothetical protein VPH35_139654 [Triticum aestivum]
MESYGRKVLVDYNYHRLQQEKQAYAKLSDRLSETTEEINQRNQTIKQVIREASNYLEEVHSTTAAARISLEEKGIYSEDNVPEPVYDGLSDEETNEDYHQDMDDDCAHYVRSP